MKTSNVGLIEWWFLPAPFKGLTPSNSSISFVMVLIMLLLEFSLKKILRNHKKHKHIFRFKKVWLKDPKCEALIEKLWNGARLQGHL